MSSYEHALKSVLGAEVERSVLRRWIGRTLVDTFGSGWPEHAAELIAAYREWNDGHLAAMVTAYDGIPQLVSDLTTAGIVTGVATAKGRSVAVNSLRVAGVGLPITVAAEDTARHKPDPAPLLLARQRLGMTTEPTVYVGDALVDIAAAKAAGLDVVAVTWGAGEPDALAGAAPTALVSSVGELRALLLG